MSWEAWTVFALFWLLFVTTPGPNAVNCVQNGMAHGFSHSLWGVLGILTQSALFLTLSALGITALIAASPTAFQFAKWIGAVFLIWTGIRNWRRAGRPISAHSGATSIYTRAFLIATINPKSVAGYLAAFSQFVQPDIPIGQQMWVIVPTALTLTTASYVTWTALGTFLGKAALGALGNLVLRRGMAACFIVYGGLLAGSSAAIAPN